MTSQGAVRSGEAGTQDGRNGHGTACHQAFISRNLDLGKRWLCFSYLAANSLPDFLCNAPLKAASAEGGRDGGAGNPAGPLTYTVLALGKHKGFERLQGKD